MLDDVTIEQLVLRVPGLSAREAHDLANDVGSLLVELLPPMSGPAPASLSLRVRAGATRQDMARDLARQIAAAIAGASRGGQ